MATRIPSQTAPPEFLLEAIREGADFRLYCGRQQGNPSPVLAATVEQSLPENPRRPEHEYRSQPSWSRRGRPSRLRSRVTRDARSFHSPTRVVSPRTALSRPSARVLHFVDMRLSVPQSTADGLVQVLSPLGFGSAAVIDAHQPGAETPSNDRTDCLRHKDNHR